MTRVETLQNDIPTIIIFRIEKYQEIPSIKKLIIDQCIQTLYLNFKNNQLISQQSKPKYSQKKTSMFKPPTVRKLPRNNSASKQEIHSKGSTNNARYTKDTNLMENNQRQAINSNKKSIHNPKSYKHIPSKINTNAPIGKKESNSLSKQDTNPRPNIPKPPLNSKIPNNVNVNTANQTIPQKVQRLEKVVQKLQTNVNGGSNVQLQQMLIRQIQGIKNELHQIKQRIGLKSNHHDQGNYYEEQNGNQENIYAINSNQNQNQRTHINPNNLSLRKSQVEEQNVYRTDNRYPQNNQQNHRNSQVQQSHNPVGFLQIRYQQNTKKELLEVGRIQPYLKQFKLLQTETKAVLPFYRGYHKKSSKPVIIKYCNDNMSMQPIFLTYEKLWKNIVKAKNGVCINKIYDINEPLAHNILVMEQNKCGLQGILNGKSGFAYQDVMVEILKSLQFLHQCGFLYRNIRPQHVMMNYSNQIVLIDFKRMRKFVDPRGKVMEVRRFQENANIGEISQYEKIRNAVDEFSSNSQLMFKPQGRKDDLQSLGYLALFILQGKLPWTGQVQSMMKVRPKLTLQQLYGRYEGLLSYMIAVHKMSYDEAPNYDRLAQMLKQ